MHPYVVVEQFYQSVLLAQQVEVAQSVGPAVRFCLLDGGVGEDIDQYFSEFVLVVVVVGVESNAELLKSEISFSLSLHYNYLKL
jgi:hypothetical protein